MPLQVKIAPVSPSSRRRNSGRSPAGKKYRSVSCENLNCETGAKCDNEIGTTDAIRRRHDGPSSKKDQGVAKQSAASSESGNTVVDIGHQVGVTLEELNESSSYLHWYYEIACFLCVVPWRRGRKPKSPLMVVQWVRVFTPSLVCFKMVLIINPHRIDCRGHFLKFHFLK